MPFLDEPNAHLDMAGEAALLSTLQEARAHGVTVVVSTHRTGLLRAADRILLLRDGKVQFYRTRDHRAEGRRVMDAAMRAPAAGEIIDPDQLQDSPRRALIAGGLVAFLFFVVLTGWAAFAPRFSMCSTR